MLGLVFFLLYPSSGVITIETLMVFMRHDDLFVRIPLVFGMRWKGICPGLVAGLSEQ